MMTLRVRSANHYSAGVECWVSRPNFRLRCGNEASAEEAWAECLPWLRRQAEQCSVTKSSANLARSHASPAADPTALLRTLARSSETPEHTTIRRRRLRSAVPSERGVLIEQSDLFAGGRSWRALCCEATSSASLRLAVSPLRDLVEASRCAAAPLVVSPPQFLKTVLRTIRAGATATAHAKEACADERSKHGGGPSPRMPGVCLSDRLLNAWYDSGDVFSQRLGKAALQRRDTFPPPVASSQRLLAEEARAGGLPFTACGAPAAASSTVDAVVSDSAGTMMMNEQPPWMKIDSLVREMREAVEAAGPGTLSLFPATVIRRAIGEAASAGDVVQLEQLLIGVQCSHHPTSQTPPRLCCIEPLPLQHLTSTPALCCAGAYRLTRCSC
jgi:hypothetical protein